MIAWIAWKLSTKYQVAILSRGYGRKSRGFQMLNNLSTPETVGDEPMELNLLLPDISIAVDSNRKRGIQKLASGQYGKIDLILMDDGFQHRRVSPGFSIVLDNFNHPMSREKLLPAGLRRESLSALKRADLIIETKKQSPSAGIQTAARILLITGIADPQPLADEISKTCKLCHHQKFPDHHRYTKAEAVSIRDLYYLHLREAQLAAEPETPLILTTGKDYVKLNQFRELDGLPLRRIPYGPPIGADEQHELLQKIYQYVEKAIGNR